MRETILTSKLKKTFIKSFNLPIQLIDEHFDYYIDLLDPYYNTKKNIDIFNTLLNNVKIKDSNIEEWFFKASKDFTFNTINKISRLPEYQDFCEMNLSHLDTINKISSKKLYSNTNVNDFFCSIDLKKANFQALNFISNKLVLNSNNYKELIIQNSDPICVDYFSNSKQIRQHLFGNLNPKRQQKIQKYIMDLLVTYLIEIGINKDDIIESSADEVCFKVNSLFDINSLNLTENFDFDFHINLFQLKLVKEGTTFYYKKDVNTKKIEFKNIPSYYIPECIKFIEKKEIDYRDKLFLFEGRISQFNDILL